MNVYVFITPIVLLLMLIEIIYNFTSKSGAYGFQDTITNLATGIGNQCVNLAVAFFVYEFYGWLYQFAPWEVPVTWYWLIVLLLVQDFVFYWFHRAGHSINIFWAAHMPHHSSEEMNLSVGVRASFTQRLFQFLFFDWVLVLLGFSPEVVYAVAAIHLLLAYWHHTKFIKNMGWFEKWFATPSHHRVHHGVNPQYIDKNFSEFLIIWDKIFGTFEPEKEEVCYGITHPPRTWDPVYINFQYWKQLWDDFLAAPFLWDKIRLWFMPLGWRPRGLTTKVHGRVGYTLEEQTKYKSHQFKHMKLYLILQVVFGLGFLIFTIDKGLPFDGADRLLLSSGVFLMIVAWGGLLMAKKWAVILEVFRLVYMGITMIVVLNYTGVSHWTNWSTTLICGVAGFSLLFLAIRVKLKQLEIPSRLTKNKVSV